MTPTSRPARTAAQLANLLDQPPSDPTQALAARLVTTAHLLWTAGHLATTRAAEHAPGIRAANTDPHRTHGGDPTATAALNHLEPDDGHIRPVLTDSERSDGRPMKVWRYWPSSTAPDETDEGTF